MLESLPGVGKVQARRIMDGARHQREPAAPRARAQPARRAAAATRRSSAAPDRRRLRPRARPPRPRRPVGGRQGHHRRAGSCERDPALCGLGVVDDPRRRAPARSTGVDYHFVTRDEFEALRDAGGFLEWFEVYGDLKGTPRAPGRGAPRRGPRRDARDRRAGRAGGPGACSRRRCSCSCRPPSPEEQRRRLEARGDRVTEPTSSAAWPRPRPRRRSGRASSTPWSSTTTWIGRWPRSLVSWRRRSA